MAKPIEIFLSYAHRDRELMDEIREHLVILERQGRIVKRYDAEIRPGKNFDKWIIDWLRSCDIILLFISRDFLNSKYIQTVEMKEAFERYEAGKVQIIPIILRPCLWKEDRRLSKLKVLPQDGKPVIHWEHIDDAGLDIANGVLRVIEELE